jgi:soluble lytic murein transglycosylase-like protein
MTTPNNSPILRSAALQKALALAPVRRPTAAAAPAFATTLSAAESSAATRSHATSLAAGRIAVVPDATDTSRAVPFQNLIESAARKYGVRPALLAALVKQESNFSPNAQSGVGAKGLTQLMDATARGLGVTDAFDPAQSLDGGARFLGGLLKQFKGNESLALAAYNAGPGAVQKYGGIPPYQETQRYVPKVLGYAAQFGRIWAGS